MSLIVPENYDPKLSIRETEEAIRYIRETFQDEIGKELNLQRMSAPMFVEQSTGLNDNLNRVEAPVSFTMKDLPGETIEIVHSLAKWKRIALKKYGFGLHEGLYTNMNAIRKDEDLDNFHSIYVDQWDWEKVIAKEERTEATLKATVRQVFKVIKHMEHEVWYNFPQAVYHLPDEIHFVTTQELEDRWPELSPMEREDKIAEELGCVFVMKIGDKLQRSGEPLQTKLEVSSKGIRVDERAMKEQLEKAHATDRAELPFHRDLLAGKMPYTIGGGIGQSRLCMLLLGKAHVGEVQASIWPEEMKEACAKAKIQLL